MDSSEKLIVSSIGFNGGSRKANADNNTFMLWSCMAHFVGVLSIRFPILGAFLCSYEKC